MVSSQARPTWEGVTPRDSATARTAGSSVTLGRPGIAPPSGKNGTQAMPSAVHSRSMSSSSRETRLYAFCTQTMPAGRARRSPSRVTQLRPIAPILPSSRRAVRTASWSSRSTI
ncbi:hypothetical protein SFUMM280S_07503 [Streptomyces fumanus]